MKKFSKVVAMTMVGSLAMGGLAQPTYAAIPDHYEWCNCKQCQTWDLLYKDKVDAMNEAMADAYWNTIMELDRQSTPEYKNNQYNNSVKASRMIPVDEAYSVGMKLPLVDGVIANHYAHPMNEGGYYNPGSNIAVASTVNSFIQTEDGVSVESQDLIYPKFSGYDDNIFGVQEVLDDNGIVVEVQKFNDMLHLQETMAAGEGKRMILLDIDPSVISNKDTDAYLSDYKEGISKRTPHTIIIKGIYINENNEVTFSVFDPYSKLISGDISQHRMNAITLGMGNSNMIVVDYDKF